MGARVGQLSSSEQHSEVHGFLINCKFYLFKRSVTVVVEEAAEVLESHVVCCLSRSCQHLILIGMLLCDWSLVNFRKSPNKNSSSSNYRDNHFRWPSATQTFANRVQARQRLPLGCVPLWKDAQEWSALRAPQGPAQDASWDLMLIEASYLRRFGRSPVCFYPALRPLVSIKSRKKNVVLFPNTKAFLCSMEKAGCSKDLADTSCSSPRRSWNRQKRLLRHTQLQGRIG